MRRAQQAAEDYLSQVMVTTVEVETTQQRPFEPRSPNTWINSAGRFKGDEQVMQGHIEEIYSERRRQLEEAEREGEAC